MEEGKGSTTAMAMQKMNSKQYSLAIGWRKRTEVVEKKAARARRERGGGRRGDGWGARGGMEEARAPLQLFMQLGGWAALSLSLSLRCGAWVGHSSPSGYQMSKTGCSINGNHGRPVSLHHLQHKSTMGMEEEYVHGCICRCDDVNEIPRPGHPRNLHCCPI